MRKFLACVSLLLALPPALASSTDIVFYPKPEVVEDARTDYPLQLLTLALTKSKTPFVLQPSDDVMVQERALKELQKNSGRIHIMWTMTSKERERIARPIRIPIYKGLIGWRLALVNAPAGALFKSVISLDDLGAFVAGQGHDWPDTAILRANALPVQTTASYPSLFEMLRAKRFDYFPRSVVEIWAEAGRYAADDIVIDPHIAVHYPTAFYFFVAKENNKLARAVETGLEIAIKDGSFNLLFFKHHQAILERAGLDTRRTIELRNPLLPEETPLHRKELWFRPSHR
jgi:hypothetical protein